MQDFIRLAEIEQFESALSDLAPALAEYYKELLNSGFPDHVAMELTRNLHEIWWKSIFEGARNASKDGR